jgi:hypothetical protein
MHSVTVAIWSKLLTWIAGSKTIHSKTGHSTRCPKWVHSRPGRASSKSGQVRYSPKATDSPFKATCRDGPETDIPRLIDHLVGDGYENRKHAEAEQLSSPEVQDQEIRSVPVLSSETPALVLALYCRLPPTSRVRIAGTTVFAVGIPSVLRGVDHRQNTQYMR